MQRLIVSLFCIKKIYHVNEIRVKPERYSNSLGSTLMGMRPNLWASTSSWITDVLFAMKTFSIAIVGTYIQRIKPKSIISINRQALHTRDNEQDMNLQTINIVNQNSDKIDGERERVNSIPSVRKFKFLSRETTSETKNRIQWKRWKLFSTIHYYSWYNFIHWHECKESFSWYKELCCFKHY